MIDVLAMPALAVTVVVFLIYIWVAWLRNKNGRALTPTGDEDGDRSPPPRD